MLSKNPHSYITFISSTLIFFNFRLVEVANPVLGLKMSVLMWKPLLQGDSKEVLERVRFYLANGFNPNKDRERDKTLLHTAAIANNVEVARLALDAGRLGFNT
jgi:hypothetical protein